MWRKRIAKGGGVTKVVGVKVHSFSSEGRIKKSSVSRAKKEGARGQEKKRIEVYLPRVATEGDIRDPEKESQQ